MPSQKICLSPDPDKNWGNDRIQFPRLIAEAQMAGVFTEDTIQVIARSMDLYPRQVRELIDRACKVWDDIVARTKRRGL